MKSGGIWVPLLTVAAACSDEATETIASSSLEPDPVVVIEQFSVSSSLVGCAESVTLTWSVFAPDGATVSIEASSGETLLETSVLQGSILSAPIQEDTVFTLSATSGSSTTSLSTEVETPSLTITPDPAPQPTDPNDATELSVAWCGPEAARFILTANDDVAYDGPENLELGYSITSTSIAALNFQLDVIAADSSTTSFSQVVIFEPAPRVEEFRVTPNILTNFGEEVVIRSNIEGMARLRVNGEVEALNQEPRTIDSPTRFELQVSQASQTLHRFQLAAQSTAEVEPNDSLDAEGPGAGNLAIWSGTTSPTDPDRFPIRVDSGRSLLVTSLTSGGACPPLLDLALLDSTGVVVAEASAAEQDCRFINLSDLASGTYFLEVSTSGASDLGYSVGYAVVDSACGNARVEFGAGELCDDGNQQGGDGCSSDCVPNLVMASVAGVGQSETITGALVRAGEADAVKVDLVEPGTLVAVAGVPSASECSGPSSEIELRLVNAAGDTVTAEPDPGEACTRLESPVEPGTYYLVLNHSEGNRAVQRYGLSLRVDE